MKRKELLIAVFLICAIFGFMILSFERSYSYGFYMTVTGTKAGSRVLKYYDENNTEISIDTAVKYYGATRYQEMPSDNGKVYFYNGKEISASEYKKGYAGEQADLRAAKYGKEGIRVSSTADFKAAWDDMFGNYRIGEVVFTWSTEDKIDFDAVEDYVMKKYGVSSIHQNYYKYSVKGPQEPIRFPLNLASYKDQGEFRYNNYLTRHTGDEKQRVDAFLDKLFATEMPKASASDYEKILASYQFIIKHATYFVDDGFMDEFQAGYSSMYDVILTGNANCIGYANAFSYFMERYGIESYVIDGAITVDESSKVFKSDHTYNIVKLEGKFYRADLTFGMSYFLTGLSLKLIPTPSFTVSTTAYNTAGKATSYTFNETNVKNYIKQAMNMNVTTTTRRTVTTTKTVTTKVGATSGKTTTNKTPTNTDKTTTSSDFTVQTGTNVVINPGTTSTKSTTTTIASEIVTQSTAPTTTKQGDDNDKDDKSFFNMVLIGIAGFIILGYIIYKIVSVKNNRSSMSDEAQAILNKNITRTEENNNNNNMMMNHNQGQPIGNNNPFANQNNMNNMNQMNNMNNMGNVPNNNMMNPNNQPGINNNNNNPNINQGGNNK